MKKEKIGLFLPDLGGGGAERVLVSLANGFIKKGHDVDLIVAKAQGPYLSELPNNLRVVDLGVKRMLFSLMPLIKYIRKERPYAILATRGHAIILAILAKILSFASFRLILREANTFSVYSKNSKNIKHKIIFRASKHLYKCADKIVAVSQGVAKDLERCILVDKERITVINNPVDVDSIIAKSSENADSTYFQPGWPPVIIGVGRLTEQKDFATLIKAFEIVRRERLVKLLILGEGEEREKLEQLVAELDLKNEVNLCGFVSNPFPYMAKASVFVLSSAWEGFPNVLVQAMACGTPVVATNCPSGAAEILEGGKYGILTPVGDYQVLAKAIIKTLIEPVSSVELQQKCREFGENIIVQQYLDIMLES